MKKLKLKIKNVNYDIEKISPELFKTLLIKI